MSIIVPRFSVHELSFGMLTKESWHEIFDYVQPEKGKKHWHGFRKTAVVRIPRCDGFMIPQSDIQGIFRSPDHYWRRLYGVVLFQNQNDADSVVPLLDSFQLRVGMDMRFSGDISSTYIYLTDKSRMEDQTYYINKGKISLGESIPVNESDYTFGLFRTRKM
jgi:hypothetical protein